MFGVALAMSVAGLMVGPAVTSWAHRRTGWLRVLDAVVLGGVLPLVLFRLVPHLVDEVGVAAILGVAGGYFAFAAIEGRSHRGAAQLGTAILLPTLAIHSFLDGTALAIAFQHGGGDAASTTLGLALVLHRIPEGMVIAVALVPRLGVRATLLRVGALAAATVLGALVGRELLAHTPERALHVVVAVGLGVMVRMVVHTHAGDHADAGDRAGRAWPSGVAFLAAAAVALCVPDPSQILAVNQPDELSAVQAIVPLFLETAAVVLAAFVLGELLGHPRLPGRADPGWPAGWGCAAMLAAFWLGPWFAGVAVVLGVAAVWWLTGQRPTIDGFAPRASAIAPAYAVGVAIALVVEAAVPADALGDVAGWALVVAAIAAAAVLPMRAIGLVPIAAIAVHKGAPPGAGLAFVVAGVALAAPVADRWRQAAVVAAAVVAAFVADAYLNVGPDLHALGRHHHAVYEYGAAFAVAGWLGFELVRRGPRGFLDAIR